MYSCLFSMSVASQKYTHNICSFQGRIQDFKLGGAHLKKLRRAEGGAKICVVFRVKNHDFTQKISYFFPIAEGGAKFLGYFVWKITILRKKYHIFSNCGGRREIFGVFRVKNHDFTQKNHISSNFRGARAGCDPLDPPLAFNLIKWFILYWQFIKVI
jgi:hypothetical protein